MKKLLGIWLLFLVTGNALGQKKLHTGQTVPVDDSLIFQTSRVITHEEIRLFNFQNVHELIQFTLNNFSVYNGRNGHALNYFGKGRKNIKVLLNGLPILQTSIDFYDLSKINLLNVERVEIITGPTSIYYGSGSSFMTLNIITNSFSKAKFRHEGVLNTSSKSNLNALWNFNGKRGRHRYAISGGTFAFAGVEGKDSLRVLEWKPYWRNQFSVDYNYRILKGLSAFAQVTQISSRVQDRGYPIPNTLRAYDVDQKINHSIIHAGVRGKISKYHFVDFSNSYTLYNLNNDRTVKILSTLETTEDQQTELFDHLKYDEYFSQFKIGTQSEEKKMNYDLGMEFSHQRDLNQDAIRSVKATLTQMSVLGNFRFTISENFRTIAGIRLTQSNWYTTTPIVQAGFKYNLSSNATWTSLYATGYRGPTFNELFYTHEDARLNIRGNLKLKSETYNHISTELKVKGNHVQVATQLYFYNGTNGIQLVQIDTVNPTYQFVNQKAFKVMGQNIRLRYENKQFATMVALSNIGHNAFPREIGNYSFWQEALIRNTYTSKNKETSVGFLVKYNSSLETTIETTEGVLEDFVQQGFWLVDLSLRQKLFNKHIYGSFGVKNLFDTYTVDGTYLPLDRINNAEINQRIPLSIDFGRRIWFGLNVIW